MSLNGYIFPSSLVFLILVMLLFSIFAKSKKRIDVIDLKFLFLLLGVSFICFLFPLEIVGVNPVFATFVGYPEIISVLSLSVKIFNIKISILSVLVCGWLIYAFKLTRKYYEDYSANMKPLREISNTDDERINKTIAKLKEEFSYKKDIIVIKLDFARMPCIIGIFNPIVLMPTYELSERELYLALKHEFCHIRNKDQIVKFIVSMIKSVFWILYILKDFFEDSVSEILELNCDRCVISGMTPEEKQEYKDCISNIVELAKQVKPAKLNNEDFFISMASMEDAFVEKRYRMILMEDSPKNNGIRKVIYAFVILLSVVASLVIVQPAYNAPLGYVSEDGAQHVDGGVACSYVKYDGEFYYLYDVNNEVMFRLEEIPNELEDLIMED